MDDELKKSLKKLAEGAERGVARSLLRWKYKKEGRSVPEDAVLDHESRQVASRAHEIITTRSKNVWRELKGVYSKTQDKKEGPGD